MKSVKMIAGVLLVFVLGVLAGISGAQFYLKDRIGPPPDLRAKKAFFLKRLARELDLTVAQKAAVGQLIEQHAARVEPVLQDHFREMETLMDEGIGAIKNELTPEQQRKLDALRERFERRHHRRLKKMFSGEPPGKRPDRRGD